MEFEFAFNTLSHCDSSKDERVLKRERKRERERERERERQTETETGN